MNDLGAELIADAKAGYSPTFQLENTLTTPSPADNYLERFSSAASAMNPVSVGKNAAVGAAKGAAVGAIDLAGMVQKFIGGWDAISAEARNLGIDMSPEAVQDFIEKGVDQMLAPDPNSGVQQFMHPVGRYASQFVPVAGQVGKVAGAANMARRGLAVTGASSAITDFLQNPRHGSSVEALEMVVGWFDPSADPDILKYLKSSKEKPELVNRLHAGFTGGAMGVTFDGALKALRFMRGEMAARIAKGRIDRAAQKGHNPRQFLERYVTDRDPSESPLQYSQRVRSNERVARINQTFARYGVPPIGYETGTAANAPRSSRQPAGGTLPMGNRGLRDAKQAAHDKVVIDSMIAGEPQIAHEMVALIRELMESGKGNIKKADMDRLAAGSKPPKETAYANRWRKKNPDRNLPTQNQMMNEDTLNLSADVKAPVSGGSYGGPIPKELDDFLKRHDKQFEHKFRQGEATPESWFDHTYELKELHDDVKNWVAKNPELRNQEMNPISRLGDFMDHLDRIREQLPEQFTDKGKVWIVADSYLTYLHQTIEALRRYEKLKGVK